MTRGMRHPAKALTLAGISLLLGYLGHGRVWHGLALWACAPAVDPGALGWWALVLDVELMHHG